MKLFITAILYVLIALSTSSFAAEVREIELNDGSIVTGEVVSLSNGVYTIRAASLGTITIEESKVRSIRQKGAAAPSSDVSAEVRSLQERMERPISPGMSTRRPIYLGALLMALEKASRVQCAIIWRLANAKLMAQRMAPR